MNYMVKPFRIIFFSMGNNICIKLLSQKKGFKNVHDVEEESNYKSPYGLQQ